MKTKFQRMSWEEKKEAIKNYAESKENRKEVLKRTRRSGILAAIVGIYGIGLTIYNLVTDAEIYELLLGLSIIIACAIMMKVAWNILSTQVNNYLVSNLKGKEKADYKKGIDHNNKKKKNK